MSRGFLVTALRAYPTLLRVGLAEAVAYRAEMLVWLLTTTMPLVSLSLWSAVAEGAPLGAYTQQRFAAYFLTTLVVRQLTGSWLVWEMNQEIRSGALARRLLKPLHPLVAYSAENLAALPLRGALAVPIAIIALIVIEPGAFPRAPSTLAMAAVAMLGAWLINFLTMAVIGTLAFFLESSTAIFEIWLVAFMLLSGYLMPLDLFPPAFRAIAHALPFRYTVAFPVEILIGSLPANRIVGDLLIQWGYVGGTLAAALFGWRAGLKRFAAFGG